MTCCASAMFIYLIRYIQDISRKHDSVHFGCSGALHPLVLSLSSCQIWIGHSPYRLIYGVCAYYRPQTKLRRLCFYTCLSFCPQGGSTWALPRAGTPPGWIHPPGRYTPPPLGRYTFGQLHPQAGTPQEGTPPMQVHPPPRQVHPHPPEQVHPSGQVHPLAGTPPSAGTPHWAGTPPLGRYTPQEQCMLGDMGNRQVVRNAFLFWG